MFIIGLTGGISCGKSAVSFELKKSYGAIIFDIDEETRKLLQPGKEFFNDYVKHFGEQVICRNGHINKKIIREIIFHDENERHWINSVTHPILLNLTRQFLVECQERGENLVVLEIPLLFEAGWENLFDEIWAVYLPRELQLQRLIKRDKITPAQAIARINSQMSVKEICRRADFVVKNHNSFEELKKQIEKATRKRYYFKKNFGVVQNEI